MGKHPSGVVSASKGNGGRGTAVSSRCLISSACMQLHCWAALCCGLRVMQASVQRWQTSHALLQGVIPTRKSGKEQAGETRSRSNRPPSPLTLLSL